MKNSKIVLIDRNPGRNSQTYGIARELNTDVELIHEPSIGVIGKKVTLSVMLGFREKVEVIHDKLRERIGSDSKKLKMRLVQPSSVLLHLMVLEMVQKR